MSNPKRSQPFPHRSLDDWERRHAAVPTVPPLYRRGERGNADWERAEGTTDPAALADELAARVSRLSLSHRDPERFHIEKSEIAHSLRGLADELYSKKG